MKYEVIVGNIGTVHAGNSIVEAKQRYAEYVEQSKSNVGRAAGEDVTIMQHDEPIIEFIGTFANA